MLASMMGLAVLLFGLMGTVEKAISIAGFYSAPMLAFSGFSIPFESMGTAGKIWSSSLPFTHYLPVQNMIFNAGAPLGDAMGKIGVLMLFLSVGAVGGWLLMRRLVARALVKEEAAE